MFAKALGFPPMATSDHGLSRYLSSGGATSAGILVSPQSALSLATIYGCARVWCNTLGSVPLQVYRDGPKGREKANSHPLYFLLHDSPNRYMTSLVWREQMTLSLALWGNGYSKIERIGGRVVSLNPLRPDWTAIRFDDKGLRYEYRGMEGRTETYQPEDVLHIRNFSFDGIHGLSPIGVAREVIGKGLAMQQYSSSFFRNGGRPGGVLKHKGTLSETAVKRLRAEWDGAHGGSDNAGKIAVLYEDMTYESIGIPPEDAQFVDTAKLNAAEVASLYGVPANMLGHTDKTATYASAEQFDIQFVKHTVRPLAVRFEQELNRSLVGPRSDVFAEFDLDGLLRGDTASQASFAGTMVQNGLMTRNEVRRKFNLPDENGGDELTVQSNMIAVDDLQKIAAGLNKPAVAIPAPAPAKE